MKTTRARTRGFALLLTITLAALLTVVVVAATLLVKISVQVAESQAAELKARQNARLGLAVAIRELQSTVGADNVLTARSSVRAKGAANAGLMGWWHSTSTDQNPSNWLISGNISPDSVRSINYNAQPAVGDPYVVLVGDKSVSSVVNYVRAKKLEIPAFGNSGLGHFAFWVGDEGVKASLNVPAGLGPTGGAGVALIADPRGEISSFKYGSADLAKVISFSQIQSVAPSAQLQPRFHDYTPCAWWVLGNRLVPGMFNINTTSVDSWAAILRAYDSNRSPGSTALGDRVNNLADRLTGNFSGTSSTGKTGGGPFRSIAAFWGSNIVKTSLTEAGINDVSQDEIQLAISSMLVVRSDTFKIRAYGDVTDPIDSAIKAVAYCEAVVQRTPEFIDATLGRRFVVIYFRWLGPDDI